MYIYQVIFGLSFIVSQQLIPCLNLLEMPKHYVTSTVVGLGSMWKSTLMKRYAIEIISDIVNRQTFITKGDLKLNSFSFKVSICTCISHCLVSIQDWYSQADLVYHQLNSVHVLYIPGNLPVTKI